MTPASAPADHEQHRVLSIRGAAYCNSDCVFCVEKHQQLTPSAPRVDETRELIVQGAGKYNMLFFLNGEPTLNPKLFEYVSLARSLGYKYFGLSSHFRTFADARFALRTLEAGFEFFDISLHAATLEDQLLVNPIGDGGRSLVEALHGLRNLLEVGRRAQRRVRVTHKIVISTLNYDRLAPIIAATYRLGVRSYILQPVKASSLDGDRPDRLTITEAQFVPPLNELLRRIERSEARVKLYGMSRIGIQPSRCLEEEENVIRHAQGREREPPARRALRVLSAAPPAQFDGVLERRAPAQSAVVHRVTIRPPLRAERTFECHEDEYILDAALAQGVPLPFGCRMGSCGLCTGRVLQGSLAQNPRDVLTDGQLGDGYALLCQSKPRSALVIASEREPDLGL